MSSPKGFKERRCVWKPAGPTPTSPRSLEGPPVPTGPRSLTFSTFLGPFTSSCLLGMVPPSQPIASRGSESTTIPRRVKFRSLRRPLKSLPARRCDATRPPQRRGAGPLPSLGCHGERRQALGVAQRCGPPERWRVLARQVWCSVCPPLSDWSLPLSGGRWASAAPS